MNEIESRLEILIGKSIDGEISPGERRLLDRELDANSQARALLEQLRALRQSSQEAIHAEVFRGGASADEIFERAWKQQSGASYRRLFLADRHVRFAVGLAAGFILGLGLHYVLLWNSRSPAQAPQPRPVATTAVVETGQPSVTEPPAETSRPTPVYASAPARNPGKVTRQVDWYVFKDRAGNQYVVEGTREGMVKTTAYNGRMQ
jgi:anti-sigma factor RsiW